jgi:hypothetical protein
MYVCKWLVAAAKEISGRYTQITCSYLLLALFMHDNTSKTRQSHAILPDYLQLCMHVFLFCLEVGIYIGTGPDGRRMDDDYIITIGQI